MNSENKPTDDPAVMPWLFSKPFRQKHADQVKEIKARFTTQYLPRNSRAFQNQMQANTTHNTRDCLKLIKTPTLILVGADDELTPLRAAQELESLIPEAKLLVFKQGGHGLYWEIPRLFNEAAIEFINGQK